MPNSNNFDYIIVGQGLAGSALAVQMMNQNKKILVIDQASGNSSSRIAAGLFNPITGKKMTKSWMADTIFPYLKSFYQKVEEQTNQKFFHLLPLYRPFLSIEEQNEWMARSGEPVYAECIDQVTSQKTVENVNDPFGGLLLKNTGYLDTTAFIESVRTLIKESNVLLEDNFRETSLELKSDGGVNYESHSARKIIFCEGQNSISNKWFNWVPITPLKGETLKISVTESPKQIINRGVYVVPLSNTEMRVGATYNFHDNEPSTTNKARIELEGKLKELIHFPYTIIDQNWGMRPTTPDRKPIMGAHPDHGSLIIFNGLGTKGVSLAPYFSEILFRWLENEIDLNKDVDVNRYKSVYSKFIK